MKHRGRHLVELVQKTDCNKRQKVTKNVQAGKTKCPKNKRKRMESPVPSGSEKEIEFLMHHFDQENDINEEIGTKTQRRNTNNMESISLLSDLQNIETVQKSNEQIKRTVNNNKPPSTIIIVKEKNDQVIGDIIIEKNPETEKYICHNKDEEIILQKKILEPSDNNKSPPSTFAVPNEDLQNQNLEPSVSREPSPCIIIVPHEENNAYTVFDQQDQSSQRNEDVTQVVENMCLVPNEDLQNLILEHSVSNAPSPCIIIVPHEENNAYTVFDQQDQSSQRNEDVTQVVENMCLVPNEDLQNLILEHSVSNAPSPCIIIESNEKNNANTVFDLIAQQAQTSQQNDDVAQLENMSLSITDIVLDSPTSSFTIPTPQSSASESPVASPRSRNSEKKRGPGKIRQRNPSEWNDLKRKALKNSGKAYISKKGKSVPEKQMKPPCQCPKKCSEFFSVDDRKDIFNSYWELGSHEKQWSFILLHSKSYKPKRIKAEGPNRSQTIEYTLPKKTENIKVCRKMFLNTLSISEKTVRNTYIKRKNSPNEHNLIDMRGKHSKRPNRIDDSIVNSVKERILSLAPVESHYCRKNNNKRYLDGQLSYKRLHVLYAEWFDSQIYGSEMATFRQYRDIVNSNFNIAFYRPKKDQCDRCHAFKNIKEPTETQKIEQDTHMHVKNLARTLKAANKSEAESSDDVVTACFDMQKILSCPFGNVSTFYYKRKLNLYNFTVYDMAQKNGYCYMWTEVTGKKGANEICSGLKQFIISKIDEGAKTFKFWSDNCSGQNRNRIVFAFYQYILEKYDVQSITHRFLEVGHTQNEGDSVHSVIEGASNKKTIYTPDQWFNLIRWAKTSGQEYRVKEMTLDDIDDYRPLLNGKNWAKTDDGEKMLWSQVREVHIVKENINVIKYKYDLGKDYQSITTLKKVTRGKTQVVSDIKPANTLPIKVNPDKYKDLMTLCDTKIIPQEFHAFLNHSLMLVTTSKVCQMQKVLTMMISFKQFDLKIVKKD